MSLMLIKTEMPVSHHVIYREIYTYQYKETCAIVQSFP